MDARYETYSYRSHEVDVITNRVSQAIDVIRRRLYAGPMETIVTKLGLRSYLSDAYWTIILALSNETHIRSISGVNAKFTVSTPHEYNRFHDPTLKGEVEIIEDLLSSLRPDDVFFDVGANVGLYTCFAGRKTVDGTVIAFEPHPLNVDRIWENAELNEVPVEVLEVALANENGTALLEVHDDITGVVGNVTDEEREGNHVQIPIELKQGDVLLEEDDIPIPNVVKIDVDGGEVGVIRGLIETLSQPECRRIYCEIHPGPLEVYGATPEEVHDLLSKAGFELERIDVNHLMRGGEYSVCGTKR